MNREPKNGATSKTEGIFSPFRALGHVANEVPFSIQSMGQDHFLTTSVGTSFHVYDTVKLTLLFVGPHTEEPIAAITTSGEVTWIAAGKYIICCKRAKELFRLDAKASVFSLTLFGNYLVSLSEDNTMRLWDVASEELHTEVEFENGFTASAVVHPSTYLNKVLVASREGEMQLWNIRVNKLVYKFPAFPSPITLLVQSPVVDVIAIGLLDGTIILHNIKLDEKVLNVQQEGRVTSIAFRTDDQHIMATANMQGDISLWDLDKRRIAHLMKGAHDGLIPSLHFLQGQPLLITSGSDNAIKEWLFDSHDGTGRLLKSRSGHHAQPTYIRFYGEDGHTILSAARDRSLRSFSTIRDAQNFELSQGSLAKKSKNLDVKMDELKLPQTLSFAASPAKQKDWDNVVSVHANMNTARTWSYQRKAIGKFASRTSDLSAAKTAAVSACGNYSFVGSSAGSIDMFNLQSGILRRSFGGAEGHKKAITGLATDNVNQTVVSGSVDGTVKLWNFATGQVLHTIDVGSSIASLIYHTEIDMIAVASDDLCIRVIDTETQRVVREFWGHTNRVTDITFSADGRWVISASLDATIRTWDLPTGNMIDVIKVDSVPTSLSFSPTGDFLATSHVDSVGIFLWSNRTQYANVTIRAVDDEEPSTACALDSTFGLADENADALLLAAKQDDAQDSIDLDMAAARPISEGLVSLSNLARSKWQTLLNLETIKKRNKPKEAPKAPEKTPFFLNTLPGVEIKFAAPTDAVNDDGDKGSRVLEMGMTDIQSEFTQLLNEGQAKNDFAEFFKLAKTFNPSALDFEIRSFSLHHECRDLTSFLHAIRWLLETRGDFEIAQAYLAVFLRIYGDIVMENPDFFAEPLRSVSDVHQNEWKRVEGLLHFGLCMIDFIRS